ncbi:MAG: hypothetical protein WC454_10215 [Phycisphaerae bacterium]|jgi:hypothetical protein
MVTKKVVLMEKCDVCGKEVKKAGLNLHKAQKHGTGLRGNFLSVQMNDVTAKLKETEVQLADVTAKFVVSESKVKELETQLATKTPVENKTPVIETPVAPAVDKTAVLADWITTLTEEAWQEIGKQRGFNVPLTPPDPLPAAQPATMSDITPKTTQKGVGILVKAGK